jgi:hypothetical protein
MFGRTFRMVRKCEAGIEHKCISCCQGRRHGARRFPENATRTDFEGLPDGDPHKLTRQKTESNGPEKHDWFPCRRTRFGLLSGARNYLRREARHARARGDLAEWNSLAFASLICGDLIVYDAPGLFVGMFYNSKWEYIATARPHKRMIADEKLRPQ